MLSPRAVVDDLAVAQDDDPPGHGRRLGVVGDHDDRLAELVDRVAQQAEHLLGGVRVQVAGRLVGEHDRAGGARARGPRRRAAAGRRRAPPGGASGGRARPTLSISWSSHSRSTLRPASVSGSRMFSSAVRTGTRLKDWKTKPSRSRRSWVSALSPSAPISCAVDGHGARRGLVEPGEQVHQRGLAGARRAHDRRELAGGELEGHAAEGVHGGLALAVDATQVGAGDDGESLASVMPSRDDRSARQRRVRLTCPTGVRVAAGTLTGPATG